MDLSNDQCVIGRRILALLHKRKADIPICSLFQTKEQGGIELLIRFRDLGLITLNHREDGARITSLGSDRFGQAMKTLGTFFDFDMDERLTRAIVREDGPHPAHKS